MANRIRIQAGEVEGTALLNDGPTAAKFWESLPLEGSANTWGDEIYFAIDLEASPEAGAREEMEVGEVAFWPPGRAFCIFFGPTPASRGPTGPGESPGLFEPPSATGASTELAVPPRPGGRPRAASPVNPLGRVEGDATLFRKVRPGTRVTLSQAD